MVMSAVEKKQRKQGAAMKTDNVRKAASIPRPLLSRVKRGELAKLVSRNLESTVARYEALVLVAQSKEKK
jgi:hypothetical protein